MVGKSESGDYETQRGNVEAKLVEAKLSTRHVASLMAIGRPSIVLTTRKPKASDAGLGVTRLGGLPDLPPKTDWPTREGYEFDFVGQLRLDELAPFDIENRLPHDGLLSIFVGHDVTPTSEWQITHRIECYRGVELAPNAGDTASRPKSRRPSKPRGVDYQLVFALPPPQGAWLPKITHSAAYGQAFESIYQISDDPVYPSSRLLGFDRMYGDELKADDWMLLSLNDGEQIPYDFAEAVTLSFVISAKALARKDLTAIRCFEGASV